MPSQTPIGRTYGDLLVESMVSARTALTRCSCGTTKLVPLRLLENGSVKSCGCGQYIRASGTRTRNLAGRTFGSWTVIRLYDIAAGGQARWACRCACGREQVVLAKRLVAGSSLRCRRCSARAAQDTRRRRRQEADQEANRSVGGARVDLKGSVAS